MIIFGSFWATFELNNIFWEPALSVTKNSIESTTTKANHQLRLSKSVVNSVCEQQCWYSIVLQLYSIDTE